MRDEQKQEWERLWQEKPSLGSIKTKDIVKLGFAKRVKRDTFSRAWVIRTFLLTQSYLFYFKSDAPDCRCEGLIFIQGCKVQRMPPFLGQQHCVSLQLNGPRKPGKGTEDHVFLFGTSDAQSLTEWIAFFGGNEGVAQRAASTTLVAPRLLDSAADQMDRSKGCPSSSTSSPLGEDKSLHNNFVLAKRESNHEEGAEQEEVEEEPPCPLRDGYEDNGELAFLRPLQCSTMDEARTQATVRGDYYSAPETLNRELVPFTALPKGMSCSQAFKLLFSDHTDFLLLEHEKRGDLLLELPPWQAKAGQNGPPHWLGWRQLNWESVVYAPMKKQVRLEEQQSYLFIVDPHSHRGTLHVCMSLVSPEVQYGDTYRMEYIVEFQEARPDGGGVCQTSFRVFGGIVFLKNSLMKRKILVTAMKDLETMLKSFEPLVQQQVGEWHAANANRVAATEEAFARWRAFHKLREVKAARAAAERLGPVTPQRPSSGNGVELPGPSGTASPPSRNSATCFQLRNDSDFCNVRDLATLARLAGDPARLTGLRKARIVQQLMEQAIWEGMKVDTKDADLQVAGLRSINQLVLPVRQSGTLSNGVLDNIEAIMATHIDRPPVQDAALALLYSLCIKPANMSVVAAHAKIVARMTQALSVHGGMFPTIQTYARMFDFLPAELLQELDGMEGIPILQYHGVPVQGSDGRLSKPSGKPPSDPPAVGVATSPLIHHRVPSTSSPSPVQPLPPVDSLPPDHASADTSRATTKANHKEDFLLRTFKIHDEVVEEFACHLQDPLPRQGTLYICLDHLCFTSPFSPKIVIPVRDIQALEKRQTARLFATAIELKTVEKTYFFGGFLKRDKAFDLIKQLQSAPPADAKVRDASHDPAAEGEDLSGMSSLTTPDVEGATLHTEPS
eukprot:GGOE01020923.1.p1 GENE.GGOE01020923.1~~GGOE01020923.1.p1  ORF type:complete len:898 (-),score=251.30 GGOE01020923.1:236-2929(-)